MCLLSINFEYDIWNICEHVDYILKVGRYVFLGNSRQIHFQFWQSLNNGSIGTLKNVTIISYHLNIKISV